MGVDLSESQLDRAREKAREQGLSVMFRREDARNLPFEAEFDAVLMLCEGAFPLMETDEMNFEILRGAARALKPGGLFIFTTLNELFPLVHSVEDFCASNSESVNVVYRGNTFDLMIFRDHNLTEVMDHLGSLKTLECDERYYIPCEIT